MSVSGNCPECGSDRIARIVFGMVTPDVLEGEDVVLGGCLVDGPVTDRVCRECDHRWHSVSPLQWPDPRAHADGDHVQVTGRVGKVVLEATSREDVWADFDLIIDERLPRLRCCAFPTSFATLDVALEPGLDISIRGRISLSQMKGPELHVTEWN